MLLTPREAAAKMVELAKHPKKDLFPDFKAAALTKTYRLFPKLVINSASAAVRMKMNLNKSKQDDSGNALTNSKEPLRVYGTLPSKTWQKHRLALFVGLGLALMLLGKS